MGPESDSSESGGEEALAGRLERAERERDRALTELARARAELDALRLALKTRGEPEPPLYPNTAAPGLEPPFRYLAVDTLNDAVKRLLGPLHRRLKGLSGRGR
jgi:hypothetical protein